MQNDVFVATVWDTLHVIVVKNRNVVTIVISLDTLLKTAQMIKIQVCCSLHASLFRTLRIRTPFTLFSLLKFLHITNSWNIATEFDGKTLFNFSFHFDQWYSAMLTAVRNNSC